MQRDEALRSWCQAASEVIEPSEAKTVPPFALACRAYELWREMAGTPLPARQDLDPIVLGAELLPYLSIIEVIKSTNDYKWVLVGERIPGIVGMRLKDKCLSQIEEQVGEIVLFRDLLEQVKRERESRFFISSDIAPQMEAENVATGFCCRYVIGSLVMKRQSLSLRS